MRAVVIAPLPARPEYITVQTNAAGVRCSEAFYPSGLSVQEHVHGTASITIVVGGSFVESQGRVARAQCAQGSAVLRASGEPHANRIGARGALNVELELGPLLAESCRLDELRTSVVSHPAIAALAGRMRTELRVHDRAQPLLIEGLALEIAGYALREGTVGARRPPAWLRRVHERLHAEFLEDLRPSQLAEEVGVHPVSLARAFRAHFGSSPGAYLRARRIDWAAERLLREPALPLTDLALAAGFYDHSHFARVFKAQLGCAPSAYRRLHAGRPHS